MAVAKLKARFSFNDRLPEAQQWAEQYAAELVKNVSDETKAAIRATIARSIREGIPVYDAARMIRSMVGLNTGQAHAAMNYRQGLVNLGLPIQQVNAKLDKYVQSKIRQRAKTIARTEALSAINAGALEGWRQARDEGLLTAKATKEWLSTGDEKTCTPCQELYGKKVPLDQPFPDGPMHPPKHPNCRCSMAASEPIGPGPMLARRESSQEPEARPRQARAAGSPFDPSAYRLADEDSLLGVEALLRDIQAEAGTKNVRWRLQSGECDADDLLGCFFPDDKEIHLSTDTTDKLWAWTRGKTMGKERPGRAGEEAWDALTTALHELGHATSSLAYEYVPESLPELALFWEEGIVEARARMLASEMVFGSEAAAPSWAGATGCYIQEAESVRFMVKRGLNLEELLKAKPGKRVKIIESFGKKTTAEVLEKAGFSADEVSGILRQLAGQEQSLLASGDLAKWSSAMDRQEILRDLGKDWKVKAVTKAAEKGVKGDIGGVVAQAREGKDVGGVLRLEKGGAKPLKKRQKVVRGDVDDAGLGPGVREGKPKKLKRVRNDLGVDPQSLEFDEIIQAQDEYLEHKLGIDRDPKRAPLPYAEARANLEAIEDWQSWDGYKVINSRVAGESLASKVDPRAPGEVFVQTRDYFDPVTRTWGPPPSNKWTRTLSEVDKDIARLQEMLVDAPRLREPCVFYRGEFMTDAKLARDLGADVALSTAEEIHKAIGEWAKKKFPEGSEYLAKKFTTTTASFEAAQSYASGFTVLGGVEGAAERSLFYEIGTDRGLMVRVGSGREFMMPARSTFRVVGVDEVQMPFSRQKRWVVQLRLEEAGPRKLDLARDWRPHSPIGEKNWVADLKARHVKDKVLNPGEVETLKRYTGPDGKLSDQRVALRDEVVSRYKEMGFVKQEKPEAFLMGGGPGGGKSTLKNLPTNPVGLPDDYAALDVDEIRTFLHEFDQTVKSGAKNAGTVTHEEASLIQSEILNEAMESSWHLMLDGAGNVSREHLNKKIQRLKDAGYRVRGAYVTCDVESAWLRAEARGRATGRYLPEDYLRQRHSKVAEMLRDGAWQDFDEFALWDTSQKVPVKVAEKVGKKLVIRDKNLWKQMVDRADFATSRPPFILGGQHRVDDVWDYLLKAGGKERRGSPLPAGVKRGQPRMCYRNAWQMAFQDPKKYAYFEGIAYDEHGLPYAHAWNVDRTTGRIVDVTWDKPQQRRYFGVEYDIKKLNRLMAKTKMYGVLGGDRAAGAAVINAGGL